MFFDYDLPPGCIAQHPAARRDDARLLVVHRSSGRLDHGIIRDLPDLLDPGDRLVFNDTKVLPARLLGRREKTGGRWEALFLQEHADGHWETLAQTRGTAQDGEIFITHSGLRFQLLGRTAERHWLLKAPGRAADLLPSHGTIPLPPYIRKGLAEADDISRYQTVYAREPGSVAAPTAGLHFTPDLLETLSVRGIASSHLTLHVGLGTFAPIQETDPLSHAIHAEWCDINETAVHEIQGTTGRVIAVGTTSTRTLETAARGGKLKPFRGPTDLAIYPPFEFRIVQGIITNFHLPKTTLLLLVQSYCGSDLLKYAYEEAIRLGYRFYSYGDAMLLID